MMRWSRNMLAMCILAALPACTTIQAPPTCGPFKAIIPDSADHMTDSTSGQVLQHDCVGYRLNCWDPPGIAEACKNLK